MSQGERQEGVSFASSGPEMRQSLDVSNDSNRSSTYFSRRPLSAYQPLEAEATGRHSVSGGRGPPLTFKNNELRNALSLQADQQQKLYMEGYLLVQHVTTVDGQPSTQRHESFSEWTECFVQLTGTTLSIWDAHKLVAAGDERVPPSFINITDAFVDFVGMHVDTPLVPNAHRRKFYHVFALNSAGSNKMLFCYSVPSPCHADLVERALLPEFHHTPEHAAVVQWLNDGHRILQAWINAIRLSSWEKVRLDEIYTGALIRARLSAMRSMDGAEDELAVRTPLVRGRYEGWVKARFMGSTEWQRCWMVLNDHRIDDEQSSFWRILRQRPGDRSSVALGTQKNAPDVHDVPPPPPGTLGSPAVAFFYESKKSKKPFASLWHVRHVFAVYPSCVDLVENSSLFKVEGCLPQSTVNSATHRPRNTGWVLFMPEAKVSQPRGENAEMMKWIIAFMDAFHLYGRPSTFAWDARDPESPFFAYPIGPSKDRLFLDRTLAEFLDITVEDHLSTRRQLHDIMAARMRGEDTPILPPIPTIEAPATVQEQPDVPTDVTQQAEAAYQQQYDQQQYDQQQYDQQQYDQQQYDQQQYDQQYDQQHSSTNATTYHNSDGRTTGNSAPNSAIATTPLAFPDPSTTLTAAAFQKKQTEKQHAPAHPAYDTSIAQNTRMRFDSFDAASQQKSTVSDIGHENPSGKNSALGSALLSAPGQESQVPSASRPVGTEGLESAATMPSAYSRASYSPLERSPAAQVQALSLNDTPAARPPEQEWALISPSTWRMQTSSVERSRGMSPISEKPASETRSATSPNNNGYVPLRDENPASATRDSALGVDLEGDKRKARNPPATNPHVLPEFNFALSAPKNDSSRLSDRLRMLPQIDTTPLSLKRRGEQPVAQPINATKAQASRDGPVQQANQNHEPKPTQSAEQTQPKISKSNEPLPAATPQQHVQAHPPPATVSVEKSQEKLQPPSVPAIRTTDTSQDRSPVLPLASREFPSSFGHRRVADSRILDTTVPAGAPRPGRSVQNVSVQEVQSEEEEEEEEVPQQKRMPASRSTSESQIDAAAPAPAASPQPESEASAPSKATLHPTTQNNLNTAWAPGSTPQVRSNLVTPSPSGSRSNLADTPRSTFVRLEPDARATSTFAPAGLVATASQEKHIRSARAKEMEAREAGGHLVDVPSKPPPPQAGLMGSIRPGEQQQQKPRPASAATMPMPGTPQHQMLMNMYWQQQQMMMMMGMMPPTVTGAGYMSPEAIAAQQQAMQAAQQAYMQAMYQAMGTNERPQTMDYSTLGYPQMPFTDPQGRSSPGTTYN
ncbi:hypothetical protein MCUN1_001632 [Malassezia cuniculi]|uniref:Skg3/CAF120-like PH-like domain-containing protein n=1 Tax=Malassezia cuniculi TaxID=948313 RepID=A0AAF0EQ44_9BASI|nr:hypothetical protein MCUN1_001632 [Malassezia cuniculi]